MVHAWRPQLQVRWSQASPPVVPLLHQSPLAMLRIHVEVHVRPLLARLPLCAAFVKCCLHSFVPPQTSSKPAQAYPAHHARPHSIQLSHVASQPARTLRSILCTFILPRRPMLLPCLSSSGTAGSHRCWRARRATARPSCVCQRCSRERPLHEHTALLWIPAAKVGCAACTTGSAGGRKRHTRVLRAAARACGGSGRHGGRAGRHAPLLRSARADKAPRRALQVQAGSLALEPGAEKGLSGWSHAQGNDSLVGAGGKKGNLWLEPEAGKGLSGWSQRQGQRRLEAVMSEAWEGLKAAAGQVQTASGPEAEPEAKCILLVPKELWQDKQDCSEPLVG
eukprot:357233-Chlamydomonas_euryale.AAC.6